MNKPIDFEGFKRGEFAVCCNIEEKARRFLQECSAHQIEWISGACTTEYTNYVGADSCYFCVCKDEITFNTKEYFIASKIAIVDYDICIEYEPIKKFSGKYCVMDDYGYTDAELIAKLNEVIDKLNKLIYSQYEEK